MAERGRVASFRHAASTAGELGPDGFKKTKKQHPQSVGLFLTSRHYSLRGLPPNARQFTIKRRTADHFPRFCLLSSTFVYFKMLMGCRQSRSP